jgi:hypothetical protein
MLLHAKGSGSHENPFLKWPGPRQQTIHIHVSQQRTQGLSTNQKLE